MINKQNIIQKAITQLENVEEKTIFQNFFMNRLKSKL